MFASVPDLRRMRNRLAKTAARCMYEDLTSGWLANRQAHAADSGLISGLHNQ